MPRRVFRLGIGLVALLATACTTVEAGTPVAGPRPQVTAPPTTTTTAPVTTTPSTTTPTTPPIPKPKSPRTLQVKANTSIPMRKAFKMAFVQVVTIKGGEVAIFGDWAPGSGGDFACYNNCSLSAGEGVSVSGMSAGSTVSLNNLVLVVDKVSGSSAQVTVGTLH